MNSLAAGFLMTSVNFGSAVIIYPGVVSILGGNGFTFFFMLTFVASINYYCTILLNIAMVSSLTSSGPSISQQLNDSIYSDANNSNKKQNTINTDGKPKRRKESNNKELDYEDSAIDHDTERRPLQHCSQSLFGKRSLVTLWITKVQLLSIIFCALSFTILVASTLKATLPSFLPATTTTANVTRLWIAVAVIIMSPLQLIGGYRNMKYIGFLSMISIMSAMFIIIIASVVVHESDAKLPSSEERAAIMASITLNNYSNVYALFSSVGSIWYGFSGYVVTIPGIASIMPNVKQLNRTVSVSFLTLVLMYLIAGLVPFVLLQDYVVEASVITTLQRIAESSENIPGLNALCRIIEVLLFIHFTTACIVFMIPLYLVVENLFNVPNSKKFLLNYLSKHTTSC